MTARSRGVALITALLVVAIAALAATALLSSASLAIHRTAALRDSEQAWWVARGVNAWILGIFATDAQDSRHDSLDEVWAQPVDYLPVEQGFVRGRVEDLYGRFNLNNLNPKVQNVDTYRAQFRNLLRNLPEVDEPLGLEDAIQDWIDDNQNPGSMNGAEDTEYLNLIPPYRAADRPFTVVSELRAIRGMTPQVYEKLAPLVAALPAKAGAAGTPVNVNTAPIEVLRALSADTNESKLADFDQRRREEPVLDDAGIKKLIDDGVWGADVRKETLTYKSRFFQIQGEIFVGSSRVALYSLIHRPDSGPAVVLAHSAEAE
jgi:general secretion pathway protein K